MGKMQTSMHVYNCPYGIYSKGCIFLAREQIFNTFKCHLTSWLLSFRDAVASHCTLLFVLNKYHYSINKLLIKLLHLVFYLCFMVYLTLKSKHSMHHVDVWHQVLYVPNFWKTSISGEIIACQVLHFPSAQCYMIGSKHLTLRFGDL